MNIIKEFITISRDRFSDNSYRMIKDALRIAIRELADYKRYNGEPLLNHSISIATILIKEIGLGRNSVISAILHDVARLGRISYDDVEKQFNIECRKVLEGLTNISAVDTKHDQSQTDNYRDLIVSYSVNPRIILIKLADRLEVMRMLDIFPQAKRAKKSWETLNIYSQLAHKLGLYAIKTEMEDLSLKYLEPASYENIKLSLARTKAWREDFIEKFTAPIKEALSNTDIEYSIKGRTKSIYSIWRKMKKQHVPFEEVYDVFAIRIVVNSEPKREKGDCWLSYSIVTDFYKPNTERMRDWISIPKSNGYESLHTTVVTKEGRWVEVQIRSERMDEVAERGIAAHWRYKGVSSGIPGGEEWLSNLRKMMESVEIDGDSIKLEDTIQTSNKEIFVFTPNGDIRKLPEGATLLDFAFEIHTKIGSTCVGGKVNRRNVTIKDKLKNGDLVEVLTSKNQKPRIDWLNIAVTSKARGRIKAFMREEQAKQAQLGREELERKLKNWKLNISLEDSVNVLYKYYKAKSGLDFYGMISDERIEMSDIKEVIIRHLSGENVLRITDIRAEKVAQESKPDKDSLVIEGGLANVAYKMANCCNPVFGDEIFAFVRVMSGITIHRADCVNAKRMAEKYPYRIIKATWGGKHTEGNFSATVSLTCADAMGIEHSIRDVLTELNVTLRKISMKYGKTVKAVVSVEVPSTSVLDSVVYRLKQIKGVVKAVRGK